MLLNSSIYIWHKENIITMLKNSVFSQVGVWYRKLQFIAKCMRCRPGTYAILIERSEWGWSVDAGWERMGMTGVRVHRPTAPERLIPSWWMQGRDSPVPSTQCWPRLQNYPHIPRLHEAITNMWSMRKTYNTHILPLPFPILNKNPVYTGTVTGMDQIIADVARKLMRFIDFRPAPRPEMFWM